MFTPFDLELKFKRGCFQIRVHEGYATIEATDSEYGCCDNYVALSLRELKELIGVLEYALVQGGDLLQLPMPKELTEETNVHTSESETDTTEA